MRAQLEKSADGAAGGACGEASAACSPSTSRRNARERRRINVINGMFVELRRFLPQKKSGRRMSKLEILRRTIERIDELRHVLSSAGEQQLPPQLQQPPQQLPQQLPPQLQQPPQQLQLPPQQRLPQQQQSPQQLLECRPRHGGGDDDCAVAAAAADRSPLGDARPASESERQPAPPLPGDVLGCGWLAAADDYAVEESRRWLAADESRRRLQTTATRDALPPSACAEPAVAGWPDIWAWLEDGARASHADSPRFWNEAASAISLCD